MDICRPHEGRQATNKENPSEHIISKKETIDGKDTESGVALNTCLFIIPLISHPKHTHQGQQRSN